MGDFGGKLRQARERRGISLRQIAAATKISVGVLEALERNDIRKLPGGIFSRAFVRSYAAEVGLDPDETVRDFLAEFPAESASGAHVGGGAAPHQGHHVAHGSDPSALAQDESQFESQQRTAADVVLRLMLFGIPIALLVVYLSLRGGAPPPAPGVEAAPPSSPPSPGPTTLPPVETAPEKPQTRSKAAPLTIELRPTAECWVSVAIDGSPSLSRMMLPGEREVHPFRDEVVLTVGNGAACEFLLNGRPARLLGGEGQVRTVTITRQNLAKYLP